VEHTSLTAECASPRLARRFVTSTLTGWNAEHLIDTATLLTSELVTNAVVHADSPIELRVDRQVNVIRFEVQDRSERLPSWRPTGPEDTSGRGLLLLELLSKAWGVDPLVPGKAVWFTLPT
jgi:anti-sigma regulatory factor (Ser/Thr protein kinase)